MRTPCRAGRSGRAFTLFELIVVLSITAILASVVAPKYASAVARYRLDSAARRIAADIEQAKALARTSGTTQTVAFTPSTGTYSIVGYITGASRTSDYSVRLGQPPYSVTLQSASFGGMPDLRLGPFALPADGGSIVVRSGTETRTIAIDASSGAVTIQ
ncbi:MAG: prepilin-type N-terminal cleavage/methylation domain-containing protein [Phycisphaerae bacterium]|nr:prepilin-type N-terminal cleavage/methylation domain-containing protein [Phycisphaerae bacterium]MBN8597144.1 prepilin-type N-terminal cleavage/methylation domain-containing protein [Planctomycetota bacterium]